jgi:hypothetical protein
MLMKKFAFLNIKPIIVSKLIYYNAIYKIETRRPYEISVPRNILSKN